MALGGVALSNFSFSISSSGRAQGGALGAVAALEATGVAGRASFRKVVSLQHGMQKLYQNVDFTMCF